jgi:hypothetical protein
MQAPARGRRLDRADRVATLAELKLVVQQRVDG